jgi:hypothetical protein
MAMTFVVVVAVLPCTHPNTRHISRAGNCRRDGSRSERGSAAPIARQLLGIRSKVMGISWGGRTWGYVLTNAVKCLLKIKNSFATNICMLVSIKDVIIFIAICNYQSGRFS